MKKICYRCKIEKDVQEFYKDGYKKDGFKSSCKECSRILSESYKKRRGSGYAKDLKLKQLYNISLNEYNNMLISQNGKCLICGMDLKNSKRGFAVDHDHKTGKVRGLLCHLCNTGLGNFKDSVSLLHKAISYLDKYITD